MRIEQDIAKLETTKGSTGFNYLISVCQYYFGNYRTKGNHYIFKTPCTADPRLSLIKSNGVCKPYQVSQVIDALRKLQEFEQQKKKGDRVYGGK